MQRIYSFERYSLLEGGKALENVRHISKDEAKSTIENIRAKLLPALGIDKDDLLRLGSAGRKVTSGDIDLGIVGLDQERTARKIKEKFPDSEVRWMKGLSMVSFSWPIGGSWTNGAVQVDLIPVKSRKWTRFVYAYPEGSEYTSSHRNWLLASIVSEIRSNETMLNGDVSGYDGYTFKLNDGLYSTKKSKIGKTKMLKHAKTESEKFVSFDPHELITLAFGEDYDPDDVRTTEQILKIIKRKDFKYADRRDRIMDRYKQFLERQKLELPQEMD